MNDFSLLIRNINNLTDARYFAAWQPQYLALSESDDISMIKHTLDALIPWIEGPQWALELPERSSDSFIEWLGAAGEVGVSAIIGTENQLVGLDQTPLVKILKPEKKTDFRANFLVESPVILSPDQALALVESQKVLELYVEVESIKDWQLCAPIHQQIQGIVLSGSDEEKVGWKSFDQVDGLLEVILHSTE